MRNELTVRAREFAVEVMARAAEDEATRFGIIHAVTMLFASMAIEQRDPAATLDILLGDVRDEAKALIEMVLMTEAAGGGVA